MGVGSDGTLTFVGRPMLGRAKLEGSARSGTLAGNPTLEGIATLRLDGGDRSEGAATLGALTGKPTLEGSAILEGIAMLGMLTRGTMLDGIATLGMLGRATLDGKAMLVGMAILEGIATLTGGMTLVGSPRLDGMAMLGADIDGRATLDGNARLTDGTLTGGTIDVGTATLVGIATLRDGMLTGGTIELGMATLSDGTARLVEGSTAVLSPAYTEARKDPKAGFRFEKRPAKGSESGVGVATGAIEVMAGGTTDVRGKETEGSDDGMTIDDSFVDERIPIEVPILEGSVVDTPAVVDKYAVTVT